MAINPNPCLAAVLVNPKEPQSAGSYHWCQLTEHGPEELHHCYCGLYWSTDPDDLVNLTPNMVKWRTGNRLAIRRYSNRMVA